METARRSWIAQISHELRTPLAVLRGEIESIEDGARQPTREVMASLRDEVLQLNRLVNDLHTLSVADMGGLRCDFIPGDAHATLLGVTQRFEARASRAGLTLEHPGPATRPLPVRWDMGRMEQVLANLLTNSLRYTHSPGIVRVDWHTEGPILVLTVDDTAPGVPTADLELLFDPLFRTDRARQRGRPQDMTQALANRSLRPGDEDSTYSSGLGLAIVRSLVLAHGGKVSASASALGGLCVTVRLPLIVSAPSNRVPSHEPR
jgi:two-component system sensor histidine kinase BaeS